MHFVTLNCALLSYSDGNIDIKQSQSDTSKTLYNILILFDGYASR